MCKDTLLAWASVSWLTIATTTREGCVSRISESKVDLSDLQGGWTNKSFSLQTNQPAYGRLRSPGVSVLICGSLGRPGTDHQRSRRTFPPFPQRGSPCRASAYPAGPHILGCASVQSARLHTYCTRARGHGSGLGRGCEGTPKLPGGRTERRSWLSGFCASGIRQLHFTQFLPAIVYHVLR